MTKQAKEGVLRSMPQSLAAEAATIGSMIVDFRCIGDVMELVGEDDFYHEEHRIIYRTLRAMVEKQEPQAVNGVTVRARLEQTKQLEKIGGTDYLQKVVDSVPSAASAIYYAKIVQEAAKRRTLIVTAQELAEAGYDESREVSDVLCEAETRIFTALERQSVTGRPESISGLIESVYATIERRSEGQVSGIPTGYYELDDLTCGFQAGDMIVIAGRPSMGKTAIILNIIDHVIQVQKKGVLLFSLEMSKGAVVERMFCSNARVNGTKVRKGNLSGEEWNKISDAATAYQDAEFYIDDRPGVNPFDIRATARRWKREHDIAMVVIDYLQLMNSGQKADGRQQEISLISRHIKAMARELEVPVVALSQLNRGVESREDHRPRMSDLRESGSIEQDADLIMLMYREDYYKQFEPDYCRNGTAEVLVAKQRNGATGTVKLVFMEEYATFENCAQVRETESFLP